MTNKHQGVIIAGGKGTRLLPLTAKRPKPALPIHKKTPIERIVEAFENCGINKIAITVGHMCEEIENLFPFSENITFYKESTPMGTSGMVYQILPSLADDFFVISGDCVFDFSLSPIFEHHKAKNAAATVVAVNSHSPTDYGTIVSENGIITGFKEKPSWKQVVSTKINAGIYIINREAFEKFGEGCTDFASQFFPALLSAGETLACYDADGFWCDVGTPESYRLCNMHFSSGDNSMGDYISISPHSHISQSVIMNGVKVGSGTKIHSSVIGEGVSIGKNCLIDKAIIGPDCLICDNVVIEKNSVIESDTIISKDRIVSKNTSAISLSFSDSGVLKVPSNHEQLSDRIGKALAGISSGREILFFHDKSEGASYLSEKIFKQAQLSGAWTSFPKSAFMSLAAFAAKKKTSLSVWVEALKNGFNILIFDENGLPLSREEQILFEKHRSNTSLPIKPPVQAFDAFSEYIKSMVKVPHSFSGTMPNFVSDNAPSALCKEIIKLKGGKEFYSDGTPREIDTTNDSFFINDNGTDVFCVTRDNEKLDKMRLFAIVVTYLPTERLPLPDYIPEIIKSLSEISGGSFTLYGDSLEGREKSDCFYSFEDGISIVLGVLLASSLSGLSISEMSQKLPPFAFSEKSLMIEGEKGEIFESLLKTSEKNVLSGARYATEKGKTTIVPQYANAFKIFAEAASSETAEELIQDAENKIKLFSRKRT